jgi:hypothetical protein
VARYERRQAPPARALHHVAAALCAGKSST